MSRKILYITVVVNIAWLAMVQALNADKEGCYIPELKKVIPIGAEATPKGQCIKMKCEGEGMMSALTCPDQANINPNCHFTEIDLSLTYPACCPHLECN